MTMTGNSGIPAGRMYALPLVIGGFLLVAGYWPTRTIAHSDGIRSMITAQALALMVVYLTMVPALRGIARRDAAGRFQSVYRMAVIRFLATLALTGLVLWSGKVEKKVFLIWLAISYVILLKVETLILLYGIKRLRCFPRD